MNIINDYTARQWWKAIIFSLVSGLSSLILILSNSTPSSAHRFRPSEGLMLVDYRHLNGGKDGVALIEMDPESPRFGRILKRRTFGEGVLPHHLYFNKDETRLYSTSLNEPYLFEIAYRKDHKGRPHLGRVTPIDTGGNIVGEDMYFSEDGSRYYVTFLLGQGGDRDGSVGVFDAETNALIETIRAPEPGGGSLEPPFILYPHGISANEDLNFLMVTSDANPDGVSGTGNTVTLINYETHELLKTYLVADSSEDLSETVEVLLLRDEFPPFALVTTVLGGDIWVASYNSGTGVFNEFEKKVEGDDQGFGVPLEFYINENRNGEKELYVSFAFPGAINVYSLDALPDLPLKRTLTTGAGAHHMAFFKTKSGREVLVSQNNLINIEGLNDGTLMVVDIYTGEVLGTLDMVAEFGLMPESVEWAFGHGADTHH
jgi:DNA-binding beta-propeller fold protein YncE